MERGGERLPTATLLAYGLLGFPLAALNLPLYVYLPPFYAEEVGLGLATVGSLLFAARLLDVLSDPLIGELSDRFPTRFGRRRPWIILAAPLLLGSTFMLFMPGEAAGPVYLFFWTAVAYVAWTLMILPYSAWGAELTASYDERSRVTAAREGFVIVGIVFAAAIPAVVVEGTTPGGEAEGGQRVSGAALETIAWTMAIALPIALGLLMMRIREGAQAREPSLPLWKGLGIALRNRAFVRLIAAYLLNGMANGLPATLFLLFARHVLELPASAGALLLAYFLAGIVAIPFWLWLSRRISKHRAWSASMLWACLSFAAVPFLGAGDFWPFLMICIASGLSLGADLALPSSIQADVVDLDWLESGRRRTGLFFAMWSMTTKLSLALAVGFAFPLLAALGFDAGSDDNGETALLGLALIYGGVPVAIKLAAVRLVWNFPIDAESQRETRARLEAVREHGASA